MRMCDIKLLVYLTIDYTITGNICTDLKGHLIQADLPYIWAKIMAENHKQVQLSEDEKKQHDIQVKNCSVCVVAQDFQDCQHLVSIPKGCL